MSLTPINDILSRSTRNEPEPTVGMGATIILYSDRHAATITMVEREKNGTMRVVVQCDKATVIAGSSQDGSAEYAYEPNPRGIIEVFQRRPADARWSPVRFNETTRRWNKLGSHRLRLGEREEYRDPSF